MATDPMIINREIETEEERLRLAEEKMAELQAKASKGVGTREQLVAQCNEVVDVSKQISKHRQRILELTDTLQKNNYEVRPKVMPNTDEPPSVDVEMDAAPSTPNRAPKRQLPEDKTPAKRPYIKKSEVEVTGAAHQERIFPADAAPDTDITMQDKRGIKKAKIGKNTFSDDFFLTKIAGGADTSTAADYYVQTASAIVRATQQSTKPNRLCCVGALNPIDANVYPMQEKPFTLLDNTYGEMALLISFEEVSVFDLNGGVLAPTFSRHSASSAVLGWNTLPNTPQLKTEVTTSPLSRTILSPPTNLQLCSTAMPVTSCPALSLEAKNNATWSHTLCAALTGNANLNDAQKDTMSNLYVPLKNELSAQLCSFTAPAFKGLSTFMGVKLMLGALTMCEHNAVDETLTVENPDVLPGTSTRQRFEDMGIDTSQTIQEVFHSLYQKVIKEERITWSRADPANMTPWILAPTTIVFRCCTEGDVNTALTLAQMFWSKSWPMHMKLPTVVDKTVPGIHATADHKNWYTVTSADTYAAACKNIHLVISPGINLDNVFGTAAGDATNLDALLQSRHCYQYNAGWEIKMDAGFIYDIANCRVGEARTFLASLESALTMLYTQKVQSPLDFNTALSGAMQAVSRVPVSAAWHIGGQPHYGNGLSIEDLNNIRFGLDGVPALPVVNLERCYTFTLDTRRMVCAAEYGYSGSRTRPLPASLVGILTMSDVDFINGVGYSTTAKASVWGMLALETGLTEEVACHIFSNLHKNLTISDITRNPKHATIIQRLKLEVQENGMSTWVPRLNKQLAENFALPSTRCDGILTMGSSIASYLRKAIHIEKSIERVLATGTPETAETDKRGKTTGTRARSSGPPAPIVERLTEHSVALNLHDMVFHGLDLAWTAGDILTLEADTISAVFGQHIAVYSNTRGISMFMKDMQNVLSWEPTCNTKVDLREWSSMGGVPGTFNYSFTDMVSDAALAPRDKAPAMLDTGLHGLSLCIDQAASWMEWAHEHVPNRRTVPRGNPVAVVRASKASRRDLLRGLLTSLRTRIYSDANLHRQSIFSVYPTIPQWIDVPHKVTSQYYAFAFSKTGAMVVPNIASNTLTDFGTQTVLALSFMRAEHGMPLIIRKPRDAHAYQEPEEDVESEVEI